MATSIEKTEMSIGKFFCPDPDWSPNGGDVVVLFAQCNVCTLSPFAVVKERVKGRKTFEIETIAFDTVEKVGELRLGDGPVYEVTSLGVVPALGTGKYTPTLHAAKACYFSRGKDNLEWRVKMQSETRSGECTLTVVPFEKDVWYRYN